MKVELTLAELEIIDELAKGYGWCNGGSLTPDMVEFVERVNDLIQQAEELEEVDLNDCGDSCKL